MIFVRVMFGLFATWTYVQATTHYVCASGAMEDGTPCTSTTIQAAVNASSPGDTIIARSGETFSRFSIQYPKRDLVIKSSQIDSYPRNTRITRGHPALAKIITDTTDAGVVIGSSFRFGTFSVGGSDIAFASDHDYQVGERVTLGDQLMSPYYCKEVGAAPFKTQCTEERVGFFMVRHKTFLTNGSVIYVDGEELPSPLQRDTPYYVVNFTPAPGTTNTGNPDRLQLSDTPGGAPIAINDYIYNKGLLFTVRPLPASGRDALYVVQTARRTIRLSQSPGGEAIVWTQVPAMYNGTAGLPGVQVYRADAVSNITIDGFEITNAPGSDPWQLIVVKGDWFHPDGEHSGIRVLRCWLYGDDDQETLPQQGIILTARDSEVGWSIIEHIYSTAGDTQAVWIGNSHGNIDIHDNFLSATGESIMAGGNYPNRPDILLQNIHVKRNFFYKPLQWWTGIEPYRIDANTVGLRGRLNGTACNTNQANLSNRCLWYEGGNRTDIDTEMWTRYELTDSGAVTLTDVAGNGRMYIYGQGGQLHLRHNLATGTVSCPAFLDCQYASSLSFPLDSSRLGIILISKGLVDTNTFSESRPPWVKNALESKYGDKWLIEGNVFHRQFFVNAGGISQDMLVNFTVSPNGSSDSQPLNWFVSSSDSLVRNNIFRHAGKAVIGGGKTFTSGGVYDRVEASGLGRSGGNVVENNLLVDIGSQEWINHARGGAFQNAYNTGWIWRHNTAVDVWYSLIANAPSTGVETTENIFIPYLKSNPARPEGVFPQVTGDSVVNWANAISSRTLKFDPETSTFGRNILMNRNNTPNSLRGVQYPAFPATTYLSQTDDPDRDPNLLFEKWLERTAPVTDGSGLNYRSANFRIKLSAASLYASYDGRLLGADIDEIEALTGPYGRDVEQGIPTFAERSSRRIDLTATSATISYETPSGQPCLVRVWDKDNWVGNPFLEMTDEAAPVIDGRKTIEMQALAPGKLYFGKRWCGAAVDVFSFRTEPAGEMIEIDEPMSAGSTQCSVSYGTDTKNLEYTAEGIVSGDMCKVSVSANAPFWRFTYRDSTGTTVYRSTVKRR